LAEWTRVRRAAGWPPAYLDAMADVPERRALQARGRTERQPTGDAPPSDHGRADDGKEREREAP
jgi:hypothetical protein